MLTDILIIILGFTLIWCFVSNEWIRPSKYPPGPPWIPFISNSPQLRKLSILLGGQHKAFLELARRYNTKVVGLKLGKEPTICVCSYEIIKQVLTSDDYQGRPDNFFLRLRTMGSKKGITCTDGELWKEQRTFLVSHLRALGFGKTIMEDMVKKEIKDLLMEIKKNQAGIDLSAILAPSVLNILWNLTSGKGLKENQRLQYLLNLMRKRAKAFDMSGGIINHYPWLRFIAPEKSGYNLLKTINLQINNFIKASIEEHKKHWVQGRSDDFIYSFLSEMNKLGSKKSYYTEEQLVMVCLDILIAGSTTTGETIDFAFLAMILNPEVQQKVHQCLDKEFKSDDDIFYSDKHRVPYIEAVLLESQRYFSVVPIIGPRRALQKTHLNEFIIPKNTTVLLNTYLVHNDEAYWKDPENFRPERFLDQNGKLTDQDRILTFGLGKRRCLGDALAKECIFLFFVEILRRYRIEHGDAEKPTGKQKAGITMSPEKYTAKFIARF